MLVSLISPGEAVGRINSGRFNEVTQTHKVNKCNNTVVVSPVDSLFGRTDAEKSTSDMM